MSSISKVLVYFWHKFHFINSLQSEKSLVREKESVQYNWLRKKKIKKTFPFFPS